MLDATCENSTVTVEEVELEAEILSQGTKASEGIVVLDKDKAKYLTSNATDIVETIEKLNLVIDDLVSALTSVTTSLTAIAAVSGPAWAPPPALATDVASITAKIATLNATKTDLTTLKDNLK